MATTALQDLNVLECGTRLSVGMTGRLLADLGARITKVEPIDGDPSRRAGPFPGDVPDIERSGLFAYLNRGKRGVTLDLETAEGRAKVRELAAGVDLVIAGGSYAELKRWGLLQDDLRAINPNLICTAITPYGLTGPRRDAPDSEIVVTALSGIGYYVPGTVTDLTLPPVIPGTHLTDFTAGVQAASATMTAVVSRDATGRGRQVDVSEQEAFLDSLRMYLATYAYDGVEQPRGGGGGGGALKGLCNDGYCTGVPGPGGTNLQWSRLVEAMGTPSWVTPEMDDQDYRKAHTAEITAHIDAWCAGQSKHEVAAALQGQHMTSLPVNSIEDVLANPQLIARNYFKHFDQPGLEQAVMPASPIRLDGGPADGASGRAPFLGEHNAEVFAEKRQPTAGKLASAAVRDIANTDGVPAMPLAGVRILDLTWWIAGPWATAQLAMMGADVVRLESASRSDSMRATTPFAEGIAGMNRSGRWNSHNFSKRSAALNLATPEGLALAKRLVEQSDIVFENFAAGVLDRLGLDFETMKSINPDIILCSVSSVGRDGPLKHYVGMGPGAIAYSGLGHITGHKGGPHGTIPPFLADYTTAWHAALGMLSALHDRDRTGLPHRIEFSMIEAAASQLPEPIIDATLNGRFAGRKGNDHPTRAPHGYYPCAGTDRWLALSVADDAQWRGLCAVLDGGDGQLSGDARFATQASRLQHRDELDAVLASATRDQEPFALEQRLQAAGVPAGVALTAADIYKDEHLLGRGVIISPPHIEVGPYPMVGLCWQLSDAPPVVFASPALGQHNAEVYGGILGMPEEEIKRLEAAGIIN